MNKGTGKLFREAFEMMDKNNYQGVLRLCDIVLTCRPDHTLMKYIFNFFCFLWVSLSFAQENFSIIPGSVDKLLKGQFPSDSFESRLILSDESLPEFLLKNISADSLRAHMESIVSFENRNTIADNPSLPTKGILGARNYIHSKLIHWSEQPAAELVPGEFLFDYTMCQRLRHTELFAVIPGTGELRNELVIMEAHLDSRCEDVCDINCLAQGADDNGSGSALLMELARVLSKVSLNRTLVLLWCTGEEQGLGGSRAFATYCKRNSIPIKAVYNNDIVGGIECGITSSPPGCPGPALVDSLRLRIFSAGVTNSMPKNLARLSRIIIEQKLMPVFPMAPQIDVMYGEDRSGRGGDHIPFREQGYTAIRLTSSYENGDGNPNQAGYQDRQHSSRDILGIDLSGDGMLDSFYVHFNYLRNNTLVNALIACNSASNGLQPFTLKVSALPNALKIIVENPQSARKFVFGIRRINSVYFDSIIITEQPQIEWLNLIPTQYYVTATGIDSLGWYGMFGQEYNVRIPSNNQESHKPNYPAIELMQNTPNPFDELTLIPIVANDLTMVKEALLTVQDENGKLIRKIPLTLVEGINEVFYDFAWNHYQCGTYFYQLYINGQLLASKKMLVNQY